MIRKLLNFSTHAGDPDLFDDDWMKINSFVHDQGFDGLELLPVGDYSFEKIPKELIHGLHLRFFVFLEYIWKNDRKRLLEIFGSMKNVQRFYGGIDRDTIVTAYKRQFELASMFDCAYVVFHPVQCNLRNIYDWNFPWHWRDTFAVCAEILNEALAESSYSGLLLFENLWWPGSFTLESIEEYEYLRKKVAYQRCGIVLDTGHLLNCSKGVNSNEPAAVAWLLQRIKEMGSLAEEIRTVHLTCSLSAEYIKMSRETMSPDASADFWSQLSAARKHVGCIDPHTPFTDPAIAELFNLLNPEQVVFEFSFQDRAVWEEKIYRQKQALLHRLW